MVNDDGGVKILCPDGQFPSYDPLNYEPEQVIPTVAAPPPPVSPPAPEIPDTGNIVTDKETPCPGPGQLELVMSLNQVRKSCGSSTFGGW